ncbi:molybdate ABC transporter substrate-binding protein [Paralimibaculum aggregatum]|uniref:Molybdate ABC transporter substrate-binding protein n=1 Tax=Paralimibaculum aggregatum TaxID=3036245 RepID=A0ABQ6LRR0_9RHOB|nr:molybdate ABC transporter substrate-binding protein [Limibaculum sp. NKW23]GMG84269.1 molybdate ABC transporter substrate-binding protein [Limibaculum sp. NKW23]
MRRRSLLAALLALPPALSALLPARGAEPLTVFAAASLTDALEEIAAAHAAETGRRPRLAFAASSTLARQIEAGAPADLFLSANARWMDRLEAKGLLAPGTRRDIAGNRLVLVGPAGTAPAPAAALLAAATGRIALGDPDHVPAGIYARAALEHLGLWDRLAPRLARADNTRAALALVARGETPLGIVYASDALVAPDLAVLAEMPADSHPPIRYPAAIVAGRDGAAARAFLERLSGAAARAALARHGLALP